MMLRRNTDGEMSMLTETFIMACSIFVAILKSPSSHGISNPATSIQEAPKHAFQACLNMAGKDPSQLLVSLYRLKEVYAYSYEEFSTSKSNSIDLRNSIINLCASHLLPWILICKPRNLQRHCSLVVLLGSGTGQYIRDAACYIPSDPADMLFLLGQKSADNLELSSSQNFADKSYQISYSLEAERILFYLVTENEWDLPSAVIHSSSLRWLFQQENISKPLSYQILKFCRSYGMDVVVHGSQTINEKVIAELVAAGDNHAAAILVSLLIELVEQEGHDMVAIVNFMEKAIDIFPATSDQLCLHGIGNAIRALYYKSNHYSSHTFMAISLVTFNVLRSVQPEVFSDNEAWVAVTIKLIDCLVSTVAVHGWAHESPVEWKVFVDPLKSKQSLTAVSIHCHDLCRLMHFGSPSVKLVSSNCLLELFTRLSDQKSREHKELNLSTGFLMSIMAVLEGLVFYSDIRVAMNCGLCPSMVLGWKNLDLQEKRIIAKNYWYRLIVEEMALSLACLASKSFFSHHKPAVHVAIALLKLDNIPVWLRTVFDDSCKSGIIGNLGASNVSSEMVLLFRELLKIASPNHVLQACRKNMYSNSTQDDHWDEQAEKKLTTVDDLREVREYLIHLMSCQLSMKSENEDIRLLEELKTFFGSS
ncbi:hypothetical protein Patl1_34954 [Pistacia atlantica]|uniref:Uncharacterized protein n=1 Tax=Pistacia atlantica TaxID=434234 RepID=A0ACC0ZR88_9ROSI|nr:hypothetical protein Patl1_34954 [Pistacia atlantica]